MFHYNYKFWLATTEEIDDLLRCNNAFKNIKPTTDKIQAHEIFSHLYARYLGLVNNLSYLYDQTGQVQKRALIKTLLEASSKRLLELRNELKNIELSEFIYLDKMLIQKKFIPKDIQLLRPYYFPIKRDTEIQDIIDGIKVYSPPPPSISEVPLNSDNQDIKRSSLDYEINADIKEIQINLRESNIDLNEKQEKINKIRQSQSLIEEIIMNRKSKSSKVKLKFINKVNEEEEMTKINPRRQAIINAVNMIKKHDRARRARLLLTNIKFHPDRFKPTYHDDGKAFSYKFTYKEDTPMLIPIKQITINMNYYQTPVEIKPYDFYEPPIHHHYSKKSKIKDDSSQTKSLVENPSETVLKPQNISDKTIKKSVSTIKAEEDTPKLNIKNPVATSNFDILEENQLATISKQNIENEIANEIEEKYNENLKLSEIGQSNIKEKYSVQIIEQEKHEEHFPIIKNIFEIPLDHELANKAARKIQLFWRMYKTKKATIQSKINKLTLYNMIFEHETTKLNKYEKSEKEKEQSNKRPWLDEQFRKICEDEKDRIVKVKGPWIMEDISDHIREWFREFYDKVKDFHRYPEEWEGGTILLLKGETETPEEFLKNKRKKKMSAEEKKKLKEQRQLEREKQKELKRKQKELEAKRKREEAKRGKTYNFNEENNENFETIKKTMETYKRDWINIDEMNNVNEEPYMEWIREDKYAEVHQELRLVIDNLMRIELELLRKALAKDTGKKYKPPKKKKSKKGKKGKRGKRKKKKEEKDLTADRSIESLFHELDQAGIIKRYHRRTFDEYIGDYNYCAYEMRNFLKLDPLPSRGEIKDIFREWLIGMGPLDLPKPKSICITGPIYSGKKILSNIIATEIDAVLFDLNPENVIKFENNMPYFIHLITKMSRILQPTVIQINQVHRIFWKKVPKNQKHLKPKLLGKYLFKKIIKPIKVEDKVLVLGITDAPWQAKFRSMKKCFEKTLLLPKNDYATTFLIWQTIGFSMCGIPKDFNFSALAKVTNNYKAGEIIKNIENTCNIRRRMKFHQKPLQSVEFLDTFFQQNPPRYPAPDTEYRKYLKFFTKINKLQKLRAKHMKEIQQKKDKTKKTKKK